MNSDTGEMWFQRETNYRRSWHQVKDRVVKPLQVELVAWCGLRWPQESVAVVDAEECPGKICKACIIEQEKIVKKEEERAALEQKRIFTRSESTRFNE